MNSAHSKPADDVLSELGTDSHTGLSSEEARRRRERYGPNSTRSDSGSNAWQVLWRQVRSAVVGLLLAASVAGFLVGEVVEAIAVLVVLIVNTAVGLVTELRAARAMDALSSLLSVTAEVERDDRRTEMDAVGLVPGDIVGIEAGERVPADLRLIECENLMVDESSLTGESQPVGKSADPVDGAAELAERFCMAYMGTLVATGRARGVVVATGRGSEIGQVVELTEATEDRSAPLQAGLDALGKQLSVGVALGAVVLSGIGILRGRETSEVVEVAIAVAIAVVPEGLPAVATLTLAVGMRRMAERGALVRRLAAVETLGSTTVICSDKTGTLTQNRMAVTEVVSSGDSESFWETAVLCNDADLDEDGQPVGDPTEVALLEAAGAAGVDWRALRESITREAEVPFDPEAKRMAVVVNGVAHAKGAPEVLIDPATNPDTARSADELAERGLRVLALARGRAPVDSDDPDSIFAACDVIGVVGLEDPVRESAVQAVQAAHRAGIRVVMITGDRPDTGLAVAERLGLRTEEGVRGSALGEMDDDELDRVMDQVDVFARVDPAQKYRIVSALQRRSEVVAVTGDGVNDAPALSQADIGVAMGAGTDVAQEAADIVLTDDDFATIEASVAEGRRIFENIRRFGQFLFSWHVAEVALVSIALIVGFDSPITGLAILWNNLIIDVLPSFALALEPGSDEVMAHPPRAKSEPVITGAMVRRIALHGSLVAGVGLAAHFLSLGPLHLPLEEARTVTFLAISAGQTLAVFNARTHEGSGFRGAGRNRWLWAALGTTAVLEAMAVTLPGLRGLLGLGPLGASGLALATALALIPLVTVQGYRFLRRS